MADQDVNPHASAREYYTSGKNSSTYVSRHKTFEDRIPKTSKKTGGGGDDKVHPRRRGSYDPKNKPRRFLIDVEETQRLILEQEDTDGDFQITVNDIGPKNVTVGTADSEGYKKYDIRGTYMLSNLLQELALAKDYGRKYIVLDEARLNENPVDRLSRMIRTHFWDGLIRCIDADGLEIITADPKNRSANRNPRIYIPHGETETYEYYLNVARSRPHLNLDVQMLPEEITPHYIKSINDRPGILTLAMRKVVDPITGVESLKGVPFVVPGGRFNEMYGWDSYFETLGLVVDGRYELGRGMVDNFVYEIKHYGKILNANRSYYLGRSQPPFLTDMALKVYERLPESEPAEQRLEWLKVAFCAAVKEYETVWMAEPRYDPVTGLSRFHPSGVGIPPETEASHFDHIIEPYAKKLNMTIVEYAKAYNDGVVVEAALDEYFLHDRAVRESGHDTTYRYEKRCAHLATIDLNTLLYKYEVDIAEATRDLLGEEWLDFNGRPQHSSVWLERAAKRKERIDKYLWNEEKSLYFDYDTVKQAPIDYETVTAFWALWSGVASQYQADAIVRNSLAKFEVLGGLVCGTEGSRGVISLDRPNRQWDFPFGWAPHQIMAWYGLEKYGFVAEARRLAYRWLYTITKSFFDFNGVVPEKFDVVSLTHKVQVEYGNVGVDFKFVPREGFGWMNASYQVGLSYLTSQLRRALGTLSTPEVVFKPPKSPAKPEQHEHHIHARRASAAALTKNGSIPAAMTVLAETAVANGVVVRSEADMEAAYELWALRDQPPTSEYTSTDASASSADDTTPLASPAVTPKHEEPGFVGIDLPARAAAAKTPAAATRIAVAINGGAAALAIGTTTPNEARGKEAGL